MSEEGDSYVRQGNGGAVKAFLLVLALSLLALFLAAGAYATSVKVGGLNDVNLQGLSNGQVLAYNSTTHLWVNSFASGSGSLGGLVDVSFAGLADGNLLQYNATLAVWVNVASADLIPTLSLTHSNISDWNSATSAFLTSVNWGDMPTLSLTHNNISDWNTATSGFLTSVDWGQMPTLSLTHNNISDWNTATSGFLTASGQFVQSVSSPLYMSGSQLNLNQALLSIGHGQISDWNTATSGFLTSIPTLTLSHSNITDWTTSMDWSYIQNKPSLSGAIDQNVNTTGSPTFQELFVGNTYGFDLYSYGIAFGNGASAWDTFIHRVSAGMLQTDKDFIVNGTLYMGATQDTNLYRASAGMLRTDGNFTVGQNLYVTTKISSSQIQLSGAASGIEFDDRGNSGTSYIEYMSGTSLRWYYAGDKMTLDTSGNLVVAGAFVKVGAGATSNAFYSDVAGDSNYRFTILSSGAMYWNDPTGSAWDTNLYREGANYLKTDDSFGVSGNYLIMDNPSFVGIYLRSNTSANIFFGTADDVNLYRSAANLKTDNNLIVAGTLTVSSSIVINGNQIRDGDNVDATHGLYINYAGYAGGTTQFRDTYIYNGKGASILNLIGSTKEAQFAGSLTLNGVGSEIIQTAASGYSYRIQGNGEADYRFSLVANGEIVWGDGTNAWDTNLYRIGANDLATDDSFFVGGAIYMTGLGGRPVLSTWNGSTYLELIGTEGTNLYLGSQSSFVQVNPNLSALQDVLVTGYIYYPSTVGYGMRVGYPYAPSIWSTGKTATDGLVLTASGTSSTILYIQNGVPATVCSVLADGSVDSQGYGRFASFVQALGNGGFFSYGGNYNGIRICNTTGGLWTALIATPVEARLYYPTSGYLAFMQTDENVYAKLESNGVFYARGLTTYEDYSQRLFLGRFSGDYPWSYFALSANSFGFKWNNAAITADIMTLTNDGDLYVSRNLYVGNFIQVSSSNPFLRLTASGGTDWVLDSYSDGKLYFQVYGVSNPASLTSDGIFSVLNDVYAGRDLHVTGNGYVTGALSAGNVTANGIKTQYLSGAYGATWASLPTGSMAVLGNGTMIVLWNTDTNTGRIYVQAGAGWHYTPLT